jgi:hypothetical protein
MVTRHFLAKAAGNEPPPSHLRRADGEPRPALSRGGKGVADDPVPSKPSSPRRSTSRLGAAGGAGRGHLRAGRRGEPGPGRHDAAGAFFAAAATLATATPWIGWAARHGRGRRRGAPARLLSIRWRSDQVVSGIAAQPVWRSRA